jgi:hypothetical protein
MTFKPINFDGDSQHYDMLYRAAADIASLDGVTIEIGLRRGAGTETIVQALLDRKVAPVHMAIDPYGDVDYPEDVRIVRPGYTNDMRRNVLPELYEWLRTNGVTFIFWPLTDEEFFRAFPDGPPIYDRVMTRVTNFSLVHFDGPHSAETVMREVHYFAPFTLPGGAWVFDDPGMYFHDEHCDHAIRQLGFVEVERANNNQGICRRIWYRKAK